jgi:hypothetical protein
MSDGCGLLDEFILPSEYEGLGITDGGGEISEKILYIHRNLFADNDFSKSTSNGYRNLCR